MATATSEIQATPGIKELEAPLASLFQISLDTYNRMGELGLLTPSDRVVLLDGLLVKKMTKGPRHSFAILAAMDLLRERLPVGFHIRPETPVELRCGPEGDSAPEPDVTVARGTKVTYRDRNPVAADVLLVVEVADSSLRLDRRGLRRYAWFAIPTVWIINLRSGNVEVHSDPSGPTDDPAYATKITRTIGESLDLTLDGQRVEGLPVADLFG